MNLWVLGAGVLGIFTALVHVFAGQADPVRPFLNSDLDDVPKATFLACWHIVSATLIIAAGTLTYAGWFDAPVLDIAVIGISTSFIVFSAVFLGVGWFFFGHRAFFKLPQWVLLLPIGCLGMIGAT